MKIRVMLVREYDLNQSLTDLNIEGIDWITGIQQLEVLDEEARTITTWLVEGSAEVVEE